MTPQIERIDVVRVMQHAADVLDAAGMGTTTPNNLRDASRAVADLISAVLDGDTGCPCDTCIRKRAAVARCTESFGGMNKRRKDGQRATFGGAE